MIARVAAFSSLGIWIYLALFRGGFSRLRERLKPSRPARDHTVTAVIPARDERDFIARAVSSLHAQRTAGSTLRVVVADDESSDGTGETSAADLVVRVSPRPPGWKGKLWALACGLEADASRP